MKQYIVDAFTEKVFHGNPATVCVLPQWPEEKLMMQIAMENNLSETAFVVKESGGYHLRWFTPTCEVGLCGHATLASGFVVLNYYEQGADSVTFSTKGGDLTVDKKGEMYEMRFPNIPLERVRITEEMFEALGTIPVDAIYTPIVNVNWIQDDWRVEQKTDYEKLTLEITTDGSISPKEALKEAAKILIYHFMLFSDEKITLDNNDVDGTEEFDEEILRMRQLLKTKLTDMSLSVRALNCLKAADVDTLGDLVRYQKNDLLKFRNFGKKSLTELDDLLLQHGLQFGTDTSKYKLDKD